MLDNTLFEIVRNVLQKLTFVEMLKRYKQPLPVNVVLQDNNS